MGEVERVYKNKRLKSRMNILERRFGFKLNKNKKFMKVEESMMKIGFGMGRKFRRIVRIRRGMMRFVFKMDKNKKLVKVEESRMKSGSGMGKKFRRFVRIRRGVMRFGFKMNKYRCSNKSLRKEKNW